MKLTKTDWKNGRLDLEVTSPEDLWSLSQVIEPRDTVTARTMRKLKIGADDDKTGSVVKKPVTLTLEVTKVQLEQDSLRLLGTVTRGPEDVPLGTHHTISIEIRTRFTLIKRQWLRFQQERIIESAKEKGPGIIICIHDREEAIIAQSSPENYKILTRLKGQVQKKQIEQASKDFYEEIIKVLTEYDERKKPSHIIIASPGFWREEMVKRLRGTEIAKKVIQATCSSVSVPAINEVLARPETRSALEQDRITKESRAVEELLSAISTESAATYGPKHCQDASSVGAVETLLITDGYLTKKKEEGDFEKTERAFKDTENAKGKILIIASSHDAGKKLDGLGGIGAVLRYKI